MDSPAEMEFSEHHLAPFQDGGKFNSIDAAKASATKIRKASEPWIRASLCFRIYAGDRLVLVNQRHDGFRMRWTDGNGQSRTEMAHRDNERLQGKINA